MIVGDYLAIGLRGVFQLSGLGKVLPLVDMTERGKVYKEKLEDLKKAMQEDLKRTNRLF